MRHVVRHAASDAGSGADKLLVVVDMQNDFIDGALGTEEARSIVQPVCDLIARWEGDLILTKDVHSDDGYLSSLEGQKLPVKHCIAGTRGCELNELIAKQYDSFVGRKAIFEKPTFGSAMLYFHLRGVSYSEIVFVGLCTGICVLSNAIIARTAQPNTRIVVDSSRCACVTPESHRTALAAMTACQIDITGGGQRDEG